MRILLAALLTVTGVAEVQADEDPWARACDDISVYYSEPCSELESVYERRKCMEKLRQAIKKRPVVKIERAEFRADYDAKRHRFRVVVPHALQRDYFDVEGGDISIVTAKPFRVAKSKAKGFIWARRIARAAQDVLAPMKRFDVPDSAVPDPANFEKELTVDALVEVLDSGGFAVADWSVDVIRVRLIGLRARVGSWSRELVKAPARLQKYACPAK